MKKNKFEYGYLCLLQEVITKGSLRTDRTGVGIYGLFNKQLVIDMQEGFPIITHRKLKYENGIREFLFMINGEIDTKKLESQGVNIWKGNTSQKFLDDNNKKRLREGELGEIYGFNLRNFNGNYELFREEGIKNGFDQLEKVIDLIKKDPTSRRITMTTNNPSRNFNGVLDPCHGVWIQFYVDNDKLSLKMTQRSCDLVLGLPTNVVFYATMLSVISKMTNLKPDRLIMDLNDVHVYKNHIEKIKIDDFYDNISDLSIMKINKELTCLDDLKDLKYEHFEIINYKPSKFISFPMAI